jgi:hypothetical protein
MEFSTNSITVRKALNGLDQPDSVVEVILGYFSSMVVGEDKEFVAPMFNHLDYDEIRSMFEEISVKHEPEWLREWSANEWGKLKPRSNVPGYPTWALRLHEQMQTVPNFDVDEAIRQRAFDFVVDVLIPRRHSLRPATVDTALKGMDLTTNSGTFYFTRRSRVVAERYRELAAEALACSQGDSAHNTLYIGGTRAKEGSGDTPTGARPIMMASFPANLFAARYQQPLINHVRGAKWFPSMTGPLKDASRLRDILSTSLHPVLSGDITSFDFSVHLKKLEEFREFLKLAFQKSYHNEIDNVSAQMTEAVLVWPDSVFSPKHFVKSGSTMTNMADSVINAIDIVYNIMTLGFKGGDVDFIVNGDDFVLTLPVPLEEYSMVSEQHGMVLQPDKQVVTGQGVNYAAFNAAAMLKGDGRYLKSVPRIARSLVYPERIPALTELGQSLRVITIMHLMEEHDAYFPILELLFSLDRQKLGYGNPKLVSPEVVTLVNDGLGYDKPNVPKALTLKGLKSWRILSDIKTLGIGISG